MRHGALYCTVLELGRYGPACHTGTSLAGLKPSRHFFGRLETISPLLWPAWNHLATSVWWPPYWYVITEQFCCHQTRFLGSKYHTHAFAAGASQRTVRRWGSIQCFLRPHSRLQGWEREKESRLLTTHQHKNRPFSAIWGKNGSKWDNQANYGKYLTTFNVKSKGVYLIFIKGNNKIIIRHKNEFLL